MIVILLALLIPIAASAQGVPSEWVEAARAGDTEKVEAMLAAGVRGSEKPEENRLGKKGKKESQAFYVRGGQPPVGVSSTKTVEPSPGSVHAMFDRG